MNTEVTRAINILLKESDSPIAKFVNGPVPQTDLEYLQLWFDYFEHIHLKYNYFKDLIYEGWLNWQNVPENFEMRLMIHKEIRTTMEVSLKKRLDTISFKPRIELYVDSFPVNEQNQVRNIILAHLMSIQESKFKNSLYEYLSVAEIDKSFLFSINEDHKIFQDKIIELDSSSYSDDNTFFHKDVVPNLAVYKVFAGLKISEKELVTLKDCPLIPMFDLGNGYFHRLLKDDTDFPQNLSSIEDDLDDETDGIDKLIRKLEGASKSNMDDDEEDDIDSDEEDMDDDDEQENEYGNLEDKGELLPYKDDLDYMYSEFIWIKALVELKEINSRGYSFDRDDQKNKISLEQKWKKQKRICEIRLQKSTEKKFRPRLEMLGDLLKLNEKERDLIKILVVDKIFIIDKNFSRTPTVGALLFLLYENEIDRLNGKKIFLKTSRLVRSSILQLQNTGINKNLFDCDVIIDNRLVEYLIGENYDISNYVEGSILYKPTTPLNNVILPQEKKKALLDLIDFFPTFLKTKNELDLSSVAEYGDSLVLLFVGPSGTGKTMLANALANHLKKKILIFNLNNRSSISTFRSDDEGLFSLLFREARMNDSILFFDEAEDILENRINDLLIEIEKHHGIVIFATNASFRIDEAMRRRINHIQLFQEPGPALRKQIWEIHLPKSVNLNNDVDLELLAKRFEINGGLIKNAVFAGLAKAVSENGSKKPIIKLDHLMEGAKEQLRNKLFMSQLEEPKTPQKGFDSIVLPKETMEALGDLANIEKARKVLTGEWGFNDVFPDHNGIAVLFYGPPGTGKTYTAEALAFETGKKLKIVNYAQVLSMWVGGTEKALEALFNEVADNDSILLFDEADAIFATRTGVNTSGDRHANTETDVLLGLIERFNSMAILTTNYINNIDKAFFRRMHYMVEFKEPDGELRLKLWKTLCPPKLPLAEDVDFAKLAKDFEFTGGDIKNVIIKAATKRAVKLDQHREISMEDLILACKEVESHKRDKFRKIGF